MPAAGLPAASAIIPIRGATPPRPIPAQHADPRSRQLPMRREGPVQYRPWHVLLVPPTPGARTRTFTLARWQARAVLGGLVALLLIAASAVTAVIVALDGPDGMASAVEVASLRARLSTLEDSLTLARAVLAEGGATESAATAPTTPMTGGSNVTTMRRPLVARILARTVPGAHVATASVEDLPVIGAIVSGFSHARRHPLLHVVRPHLGIDIAAARGTHVSAPAAGRVTYVGRNFALGLTVEIAHANGISTRYAHLRSVVVHVGENVTRGATIATVGSSGLTTGPHLHYEVAVNGRQVDPARFRLPRVGATPEVPMPSSTAGAAAAKDDTTPQRP